MDLIIATVAAISTFLFVLFTLLFIKRNLSVDIFHRLRRHHVDDVKHSKNNDDIFRRAYLFIQRVAKPIADLGIAKKIEFKLRQAGIPIFGAEFIVIVFIGALVTAIFAFVITLNIVVAPISFVGVPLFCWLWLRMKANSRRKAFTEQLGDCLTTVSNALRAGYSFQQAMDVVAREMEPPMSSEFERVTTDIAMGVALEDALENMNQRIGSQDFDLVVTAVLIQREIGGNLAQILDTISFTINERIRMKREIGALTAQGRFSAWVLLLLPFFVAAFCWIYNHDQMQVFINEEMGRIALAVCVLLEILGFFVIQRIVDIEV